MKLILVNLFLIIAFISCSSNPHKESVGQYVDNTSISTKIKTKLLTANKVSGTAIDVESYKGVVILSGFVNNEQEKEKALSLAKAVKGVREVKDALYLKSDFSGRFSE